MNRLPDNIETLRAALLAAQARADIAEAEAARAVAEAAAADALLLALRLENEKLRRELYGQRSERKARLLEQLDPRHLTEKLSIPPCRYTHRNARQCIKCA